MVEKQVITYNPEALNVTFNKIYQFELHVHLVEYEPLFVYEATPTELMA